MALEISITKTNDVPDIIPSGTIVATVTATGGVEPYTYDVRALDNSTSTKYYMDGTNVKTLVDITLDNLEIFAVVVSQTDGVYAVTPYIYPNIKASIQNKFSTPNLVYKITKDIHLGNGVLTIPEGCTLDFQGGSISNGTITLNNTKILPQGCDISDYITAIISGTYKEGQMLYDSSLKKMKLWNGSGWTNLDGTALI